MIWELFNDSGRKGADMAVRVPDTSESEKQVKENRYYLWSIAEVLLLCAQQDIAIREHVETEESGNPGNFRRIF